MPKRRLLFVALAALWVRPSLVLAEDPARTFDSLYGADLKRVTATSDPKDDVELAGRLLSAAKKAAAQPELLALLCDKAHELAGKSPAGFATAVEAMELLGEKVPARLPAGRQKLIALYQNRVTYGKGDERQAAGEALVDLYADMAEEKADAGDWTGAVDSARRALAAAEGIKSPVKGDIQGRLNELAARERVEKQLADLKSRLKADAGNRLVREQLIRLCLIDLDQPEEAAKYVDVTVIDESLRTYVPLAARSPDSLAESVCLELGGWYRDLGDKAAPPAKAAMYERAKSLLEAYLAKHTAEDASRTKAQLFLDTINGLLSKLNAAADTRGWIDVLRLVDLSQHTSGGKWQRSEQGLSVTTSSLARATIPVLPDGSYDLQVKFIRAAGDGQVIMLLPVASASCALVLSAGDGAPNGLHTVDGKPYQKNATTTRPGKLDNNREYAVDIKVLVRGKQVSVAVNINGQRCIRWEGAESDLSLGSWQKQAGPQALGLGATDCAVTFTSARLRVLSGGATVLQVASDDNSKPDQRIVIPPPRLLRRWQRHR